MTLATLKSNFKNMGMSELEDQYFVLENEKSLEEKEKGKVWYFWMGMAFFVLFLLVPRIIGHITTEWMSEQLIISNGALALVVTFCLLSKAPQTFMLHLSRYGTNFRQFGMWVGLVILGFATSYNGFPRTMCSIALENAILPAVVSDFEKAIHLSANAFFALGFWGNGEAENRIFMPESLAMRLYINVESAIGVIMLALLVATIIRKSMGR
jgi:hypothetical protein